jgi:hypothetical protein
MYKLGDIVYLKTDPDQSARIVVQIILTPGAALFTLACGSEFSNHYDFEIMSTQQLSTKLGLN